MPIRKIVFVAAVLIGVFPAVAQTHPIEAAARKLNLNADWRFIRADVKKAEAANFDADDWATVSCPHTWNDIDTFDDFGTGGHQGESDLWQGTAWYRKLAKRGSPTSFFRRTIPMRVMTTRNTISALTVSADRRHSLTQEYLTHKKVVFL